MADQGQIGLNVQLRFPIFLDIELVLKHWWFLVSLKKPKEQLLKACEH